ncbi:MULTISPECIES: SDR family oxidoreductase [unclassified Mesorhizobium]|uniref:SDR family oxidoreductase n=1 Tax=unclassified Mesorhizobium TaxID=325217 RepID=UPI00112AF595|nr:MULTISPECIES: SDR family oxidoreductase [unclassified Mesorhizobium]MBZ9701650.1 SDR family oxidoreductase [Mesorhizobium sp. CO1-1-3]MBZ9948997.1 SDR family oxidoreductase [Mesorhizobium sp. BR1-1-11]TPI99546.1 SDR family oxidoreductase [Mesorhizobium sp. B2-8-1]
MSLQDGDARKTVVVTGASAGVGRATAVAFARRGYDVGLIARGRDGLDGARREVEATGQRALVLPLDIADATAVFSAAERIASEWGHIDVWVNDAMATVFAPFAEIEPEEFRRVTEVTYLGQVFGTMAALKHMRQRGTGTIVQIGSALSYRAIPLQSAYCGAKFAIRGFTDALRSELLHENSRIKITMVQLPAVNTPQFDWARSRLPKRLQPLPPIYQPEAVADEIVQAALKPPRELWIGLSALKAIVGTILLPRVGDRILARQGYAGQMTAQPARTARPDNLFEPVAGDHGTRGRFGRQARNRVLTIDPVRLRAGIAVTLLGIVVGAAISGRFPLKLQRTRLRRD